MIGKWIKRLLVVAFIGLLAAGAWFAIKPQPVPVDMVSVSRGEVETTIDEEGKTRVKDVYRISAPISGKLERIAVHVGDKVKKGDQLARMRPVDPPIRDARTRRELTAATKTAAAGVRLGVAEVEKARSALEFSRSELQRAVRLASSKTISERALQRAQMDVAVKNALVAQAEASLEFRRRELEASQTRLLLPSQFSSNDESDQCCIAIVAPVSGTVLKLATESEQVVQAGTILVDIGDLHKMEVVVDLLSIDAVGVTIGARARIESWGKSSVLNATVRRIDPAAFTKVSALGIAEQRVNVVLDIIDPFEKWQKLGHAFRVTVKIITDFKKDGLRLPLGALFRKGDKWAVYVKQGDKASLTTVKLGTFSNTFAEVLEGINEGDKVVVYPNDRVKDGVLIVSRDQQTE